MVLKNRIIMPAMQLMLGLKNRRARSFYLERARGGCWSDHHVCDLGGPLS